MQEENSSTDVNPMDSLDFNEESTEQVETQTTAEDSSTEENKDETTDQQETEGEATEESQEESEENTEETDEGKPKAKNSAQNRIRELANTNRSLIAEKRALEKEVERLNAQFYQPQTAEQLQEQGMDETQAQVEALRQEQVLNQANQHITSLNSDINMESIQVTHDFPVFDPDSKDYDKEFAEMVAAEYINASGMTTDPNTGFITQARVLPYDFYKSFAKARESGMKRGELRGKKNAERQANAADVTPIASPKDEKKDPLMEALLAD